MESSTRRSRGPGLHPGSRLANRAVDVVLLLVAAWLLLGPRGPLRLELEGWLADRRQARLVGDHWDALVAKEATPGGPSGGGAPGDEGAATTVLVEFTDYRCPFCRTAQEALDTVLLDRPDVRVVVRHLPMEELHPDAPLLARVSVCAERDPAWPAVHRALFDVRPSDAHDPRPDPHETGRTVSDALARAGAADPQAVLRCAEGVEAHRRVDRDRELARRLGVNATPTFLRPGRVAVGVLSPEALREMLGPSDP